MTPSCLRCCFFETTRAAFMWLCILYMHISAYAHTHIQAHSLMRALTLSCARTHARTRMHMSTTHTGARAQTRMHPGTCRPDYARTHAPAHEHVCMRTHTHACTLYGRMLACDCVHVRSVGARAHVCMCGCACACACMRVHARVHVCVRSQAYVCQGARMSARARPYASCACACGFSRGCARTKV